MKKKPPIQMRKLHHPTQANQDGLRLVRGSCGKLATVTKLVDVASLQGRHLRTLALLLPALPLFYNVKNTSYVYRHYLALQHQWQIRTEDSVGEI